MIAFAHNNFVLFSKHTSPLCSRSPVSFSLSAQLSTSPHFFSSATETQLSTRLTSTIYDILLHKYDFPPQLASKLTYLENLENAYSVLSFFEETGFSNTQLVKIMRCKPEFLASSVEDTLKPKIKFFQEFGFSSDDICKLVTRCPSTLHLSLNNNIVPSLSVLKGLLESNNEVVRLINKFPWFLTANLKNTVLQNVEFLMGCGIPINRICPFLHSYPACFTRDPEAVKKAAEKAKEMGLDPRSKSYIYAIPTLVSMGDEAWEVKLQAFRDLGFSDRDVSTMFRKAPHVFMVSMEKIKKIIELLLATGKFDLYSVVNCPRALQFSIEKRCYCL